jgi:hypothetical protein
MFKLVEFKERNLSIAKDQPEYLPLPCHVFDNDDSGKIAFCWQLTLIERLKVLFTGKLWHQVLTFKQPLQPQMLCVKKPEFK